MRGLAWGERCPECRAERAARALRLSRRVALGAALLVAWRVAAGFPAQPLARLYGAIAVVATYLIARRIVTRLALEFLPE